MDQPAPHPNLLVSLTEFRGKTQEEQTVKFWSLWTGFVFFDSCITLAVAVLETCLCIQVSDVTVFDAHERNTAADSRRDQLNIYQQDVNSGRLNPQKFVGSSAAPLNVASSQNFYKLMKV